MSVKDEKGSFANVQDDQFGFHQTGHFGGAGMMSPHFLHVRSFSSPENFW